MAEISNYQGGGDIRLGRMVGGVYDAFIRSEEKKEAEAKEKALREEKEDNLFLQNLSKTMAGVPTKGLQQKDIPGFYEIYNKMEEAYIKASRTKDKAQRLMEQAKVKQYATEATLYTQQSEAMGKKKTENLKLLQNGFEKYEADSALEALNKHYDRPLSEITTDFDLLQYRNKWDSGKIDKTLEDVKKDILSSSTNIKPVETLVGSTQNGYDTVNTFRTTREIPKADAITAFQARYNYDTNFKKYVDTEFDGTLDSKLGQLYDNLAAANWTRSVEDKQRVQGRAPVRSSGGGSSGRGSTEEIGDEFVSEGVDIAYSYDNTATATKQVGLKGNGMKARISKGVRAYDMTTGDPINITTGMADGVIQEFVQLPTGDIKGKGRRILSKGTEDRFQKTKKYEDFAIVRYTKPVYVLTEDTDVVFSGKGEALQKAIRAGKVKKAGVEEVTGAFPMNSVLPAPESMTKGERATVERFRKTSSAKPATPATQNKPATKKSKVLDAI